MSEERTRQNAGQLDIHVKDVVQIRYGESAGRVGVVMGSCLRRNRYDEPMLIYYIKLSDEESTSASGHRLNVVRHADDAEI